jgi:hypothetical protein
MAGSAAESTAPCFFINDSRYDGDADYEPPKAALEEQLANRKL